MSWLTVLWSMCAGASAAFMLLNISLWIRYGRDPAPLLAALMACCTALLAILELRLPVGDALRRSDTVLLGANVTVGLLVIAMTWLLYFLSRRARRWLALTVTVVLTLQLAVYLALNQGVMSGSVRATPNAMEWGGRLFSPIDQAGTARYFVAAAIVLFAVSAGDAVAAEWRSGATRRAVLMTGATLLFIVGVAIPYPLTGVGVTHAPSLDSFFFLIVIAAMTHEITVDLWRFARPGGSIERRDRRWRPLLDNLDLIIADLDRRGITRFVNRCGLASLERPASAIVGHPWFDSVVPAVERTAGRGSFRPEVLARETRQFESHITTGSGGERLIHWLTVPVRRDDRTTTGVLTIGTDITDRKEVESRVGRLRDEMAFMGRVSMMGELAASIAHELNQPLTAIVSNAQAAQRFMEHQPPDLLDLHDILSDIVDDAKRSADITRRMRVLAKKAPLDRNAVDLISIIGDVLKLVHGEAVARNIHVKFHNANDSPIIAVGDRVQLQQALLNLLMNSFHALAENDCSVREVGIEVAPDGPGQVSVSVLDSGPGLQGDAAMQVFEPFYTTRGQGLGMGLSICRAIIEAHGGAITAVNNTGGGACFRFTLPVERRRVRRVAEHP